MVVVIVSASSHSFGSAWFSAISSLVHSCTPQSSSLHGNTKALKNFHFKSTGRTSFILCTFARDPKHFCLTLAMWSLHVNLSSTHSPNTSPYYFWTRFALPTSHPFTLTPEPFFSWPTKVSESYSHSASFSPTLTDSHCRSLALPPLRSLTPSLVSDRLVSSAYCFMPTPLNCLRKVIDIHYLNPRPVSTHLSHQQVHPVLYVVVWTLIEPGGDGMGRIVMHYLPMLIQNI